MLRLDQGFGVTYLPFSGLEVAGEGKVVSIYIVLLGREKNPMFLYWF